MPAIPLEGAAIDRAVAELDGWELDGDRRALTKTFRFADFSAAFGFMTRAALAAEKLDHHPEWFNVWNRVEVRLTTHDTGGLSNLDVQLGAAMDRIAAAT